MPKSLYRLFALVASLGILLIIAGCSSTKTTPAQFSSKGADLTITINFPKTQTITYKCLPGGTPSCSTGQLKTLSSILLQGEPTAVETNCQAVYLGPKVATVTGYLEGKKVFSQITQRNSCLAQDYIELMKIISGN